MALSGFDLIWVDFVGFGWIWLDLGADSCGFLFLKRFAWIQLVRSDLVRLYKDFDGFSLI
jgi:hypothetical protein